MKLLALVIALGFSFAAKAQSALNFDEKWENARPVRVAQSEDVHAEAKPLKKLKRDPLPPGTKMIPASPGGLGVIKEIKTHDPKDTSLTAPQEETSTQKQ